jgi:hypothetical protein
MPFDSNKLQLWLLKMTRLMKAPLLIRDLFVQSAKIACILRSFLAKNCEISLDNPPKISHSISSNRERGRKVRLKAFSTTHGSLKS